MGFNYEPTGFNNDAAPPISAENLNKIEKGILGLNFYKLEKSLSDNLFDKRKATDDYFINSSGVPTHNAYSYQFFVSDYCIVEPNTTYSVYPNNTSNVYIAFYKSDGTFISSAQYTSGSVGFSSPSNAALCRFTGFVNSKSTTMLVKGSTQPTTYIPYSDFAPIEELQKDIDINRTEVESELDFKLDKEFSDNLFDKTKATDDYFLNSSGVPTHNQYSYQFFVSDYCIVEPSTIYSVFPNIDTNVYIAFYKADKSFISSVLYQTHGSSIGITSPANAALCRFTAFVNNKATTMLVKGSTAPSYYIPYSEFEPIDNLQRQIDLLKGNFPFPLIESSASLTNGNSIKILNSALTNAKQNCIIAFEGRITSFDSIYVGRGKDSAYAGTYISVDSSKIYVLRNGTEANNYSHNLTLSDFIRIIISVGINNTAKVTLVTTGGIFTTPSFKWLGCNGDIFAESVSSSLTDCVLTYTSTDLKKKIWAFGDSYFDYYMKDLNDLDCSDVYFDGRSGRASSAAYTMFTNALNFGTPKEVIWCLGMNDSDSSAINTSWKTVFDAVKTYCEDNEIEFVGYTVPSTSSHDNSYKNAYVISECERYIDANAAVGADISLSWYNGLLSQDDTHPTSQGAKVIASAFILACPEIFKNE